MWCTIRWLTKRIRKRTRRPVWRRMFWWKKQPWMGNLLGGHYHPYWINNIIRSCPERNGRHLPLAFMGKHDTMGMDFLRCHRPVHHYLRSSNHIETTLKNYLKALQASLHEWQICWWRHFESRTRVSNQRKHTMFVRTANNTFLVCSKTLMTIKKKPMINRPFISTWILAWRLGNIISR